LQIAQWECLLSAVSIADIWCLHSFLVPYILKNTF
jgi:hypothetical protein